MTRRGKRKRAVDEYLALTGEKSLPQSLYAVTDIEDRFPVERISMLLNGKAEE